MKRFLDQIFVVLVIGGLLITIVISLVNPTLLAENSFLKSFINHELLNILAVILTITLASIANLHLKLSEIEQRLGKGKLAKTKAEVKEAAAWLIGSFIMCVFLLIVRSWFSEAGVISFLNGLCVTILLLNVLVLIDITRLAFRISD